METEKKPDAVVPPSAETKNEEKLPDPTPLKPQERRVLGVLIEKSKTTATSYPLSLKGLTTGCNQTSNRDPIVEWSDDDVEDVLLELEERDLVEREVGGRVDRWKHCLYRQWKVSKVELAVLGELLLRGAQTKGDLRSRASRMEPLPDQQALQAVLKPLVERKFVVFLTTEDRRGATLTHGFYLPEELTELKVQFATDPSSSSKPAKTSRAPAEWDQKLAQAQEEIQRLRADVTQLQQVVAHLEERLASLSPSTSAQESPKQAEP